MDGRWQQVQQKHSRSAAAVSASRTAPPATQDSGRTTRGGASKEDPQRRRADRRRKDAQTKRAADERVRKAAAAQQTAAEVARAGREAHADALLRAEQARAPDIAHLLVVDSESGPLTNVQIPAFSSSSRKTTKAALQIVRPATTTTRVGDAAPAAPTFVVTYVSTLGAGGVRLIYGSGAGSDVLTVWRQIAADNPGFAPPGAAFLHPHALAGRAVLFTTREQTPALSQVLSAIKQLDAGLCVESSLPTDATVQERVGVCVSTERNLPLLLVRDAAGVVTVGSRAKAAGIRAFSSLLRTDPAVDAEVAGARRDKDADDAAANAAAAAAADAKSKAAAAAARRVARGGIPLSSKWGAPSGVTPPADSTADSGNGDVRTRNGAGDAGTEAHSLGPNADGARCAAAFVAGDCPTPAQASALAAASRHAAASAAEHAEGKRRVATALATSAACAARAEADARQESADIQRALRISVADQAGPAHPPVIGESAAILHGADTMCDVEFATAAAELGLDALRAGPDLYAGMSDSGHSSDDGERYTGTAAQRGDASPPPESVDDRGGEPHSG